VTTIPVTHEQLHLLITIDPKGRPLLRHLGLQAAPDNLPDDPGGAWALFQLQGEQSKRGWVFSASRGGRHGNGLPGMDLAYSGHRWSEEPGFRRLEIDSAHEGLSVTSILRFPHGAAAFQILHRITNTSTAPIGIEDAPSLSWRGAADGGSRDWDKRFTVHRCDNGWFNELRWVELVPSEHGLVMGHPKMGSCQALTVGDVGSWSCKNHLPQGILEDREQGTSLAWQIEHSGGWEWQLADEGNGCLLLSAGGPNQRRHHWWKNLQPNGSFTTVPVGVAIAAGGHQDVLRTLTTYRRAIRRPNADNRHLPVIFNDYMNCLFADPTTAKELPLIAAAARAGCEIYVIDAGWYAERSKGWWDTVGAWEPSPDRFDGGIAAMLHTIRAAGMIPGLWLELEVLGVNSPLAATVPRDWLFHLHGRPQVFSGRYQLDFRHPGVRAHADATVDRLVGWGCGYIKMDDNIDSGVGTDIACDSPGDGALQHMRAYWDWLEGVYRRHPDLVVENCSSGGLRMDYGQLSRHSIQSTSDQEDWRLTPYIAAAAASGAAPEQQAVWSYPLRDGDREETVCNMVSALLLRIHQSGHLADLAPARFQAVADGIAVYKQIRPRIAKALPRWPWGLPTWSAPAAAAALEDDAGLLVAVWRLGDPAAGQILPFPHLIGTPMRARCLYPAGEAPCTWDADNGQLKVEIPPTFGARLFILERP
jgi:alpha-galactosidase